MVRTLLKCFPPGMLVAGSARPLSSEPWPSLRGLATAVLSTERGGEGGGSWVLGCVSGALACACGSWRAQVCWLLPWPVLLLPWPVVLPAVLCCWFLRCLF